MKKINLSLEAIEPVFQKISALTGIQRLLVCAVTIVVIIAAFGFFSYKPKLDEMHRLSGEIKKFEEKLAKSKRNASEYAKFKQKIEDAKAQFAIVSRALPNTEEIPSLLTSISQAGKTSGLNFLLFQPRPENKKGFYSEIPITMNLSGSYHDLGVFFDKLARLSRIVNISKCTTSKNEGALQIQCTAVTYKFIEQPESK